MKKLNGEEPWNEYVKSICVRSPRGLQFRQWACSHLKEFLRKGFVIGDERMKNLLQSLEA